MYSQRPMANNSEIYAMNSFSAFLARSGAAPFDWMMVSRTSVKAMVDVDCGGTSTARRINNRTMPRIFTRALGLLAIQRIATLLDVYFLGGRNV